MEEDIKNQNLSKLAVKNSGYTFLYNIVLKVGGLIFSMIIARMLLPELFGVYSLVLSIITIFIVFTNLGLDETFLRYLSFSIGKKNPAKARSYFKYLFKIKIFLVFIITVILLVFSKFLSYNLYKSPLLFYPLVFSCLFLIAESIWSFFGSFFVALKDLKTLVILNVFLQIFKISFSLLALMILSDLFKVSGLFISFFFSGAIVLFLAILILFRKNRNLFVGKKERIEKRKILRFLKFMSIASISLVLFGSIDTLMLGKFVSFEYLGYYRVALSLAVTISSLASFSGLFLPFFTQIDGKRFTRGFYKTLRYTLIFSIPATAGIIFIAKYIIKVIYGNNYLLGAAPLSFLSFLIITTPLIGLYSIIFQSKEKPKIVSNSMLFSLGVNIIFNIFIISLFKENPLFMISGIGLATSFSRAILLGILIFQAKKEFHFEIKSIQLKAPILATIVMSVFLFTFNHIVNMNIFLGITGLIISIFIYLCSLILFKGVTKEDLNLLKILIKKDKIGK